MNQSVLVQPPWRQYTQNWFPVDVTPFILTVMCIVSVMLLTSCGCCKRMPSRDILSMKKDAEAKKTDMADLEKSDAEVETTLSMATVTTLENLDGILNANHAKYMTGVRKELATLLNQRLPASVTDVQAARTEIKGIAEEMKELRKELLAEIQNTRAALDHTPQQEIKDAIALQASMKSVVDELKSIQELVRDIHQGSLDVRVELKAEGDRVTGAC